MSCIRSYSDQELDEFIETALSEERRSLADFLRLLAEIDFRRRYAEQGYGSLFRYCVDRFGLSEQQAYLRMCVARLGQRFPEIFDRIEKGELHMSGLARLGPALKLSDEPEALIAAAVGKSRREIEGMVAEWMPRPDPKPSVQPNPLSPGRFHLSVTVSGRAVDLIEQAIDLGAPRDLEALLEESLEAYVKMRLEKKLRGTSSPRRKTSTATKVEAYVQSGGQCTFVSEETGLRCTETSGLDFDHCVPIALGGAPNDPQNLRVLCPTHNQLEARRLLDPEIVDLLAQGFRPVRRSSPAAQAP